MRATIFDRILYSSASYKHELSSDSRVCAPEFNRGANATKTLTVACAWIQLTIDCACSYAVYITSDPNLNSRWRPFNKHHRTLEHDIRARCVTLTTLVRSSYFYSLIIILCRIKQHRWSLMDIGKFPNLWTHKVLRPLRLHSLRKAPPTINCHTDYASYRKDVQPWLHITTLTAQHQIPSLIVMLSGEANASSNTLYLEIVIGNTGVTRYWRL